jgi:hypothetical protein
MTVIRGHSIRSSWSVADEDGDSVMLSTVHGQPV